LKTDLYVFQWISDLGGADTRLKELLVLLKDEFNITCIPNDDFRLKEKHNTDFLDSLGIKYCMPESLPEKIEGFAYANCNFRLFAERNRIDFIRSKNLTFLWSNDMMWTTGEELEAIKAGKVDCCLFTSPFHWGILGKKIFSAHPSQKGVILDNYFDSNTWQYVERPTRPQVVFGKVSRDDTMKFSEDFPVFYESVTSGVDARYRVMGWSNKLDKKYSWFSRSERWQMLNTNAEKTQDFLSSIDVFLYNCNHKFVENQSRAIVEAQLTGCPVVAPNKWNFPNMVWTHRTGFLWNDLEEAREACREISDPHTRRKMGRLANECTRDIWCDAIAAKKKWAAVLNYALGGNK
jgi:glycosyltransferase involved in cell wall biosynthesis